MRKPKTSIWIIPGLIVFLFTGCASIGPDSVVRDRSDYTAAISESWKRQMLFNMV